MLIKTFVIDLPGDLFDDMERMLHYAIDQAREEADDYVIPCRWEAEHIKGEIGDWSITFQVTRISN